MNGAAGARGPVPCGTNPRALALWLAAALAVGAGVPLGLPYLASAAPPPALPPSLGGGFMLTAPDGTAVSDRTLSGAPYVVMFGYTRCGALCRDRLKQVLGWRAQTPGRAVRVVFVSVDPAYDTPARMAAFAASMPAPVLALTGSPQAVSDAAAAFNTFYFKAALCSGGTIINHSSAAYLVARTGHPEAIIAASESEASALAKLRALAAG